MKLEEGAEENNSMGEKSLLSSEQEKRKLGEQYAEERCTSMRPSAPKKRRKDDIRSFFLERSETSGDDDPAQPDQTSNGDPVEVWLKE